MRYFKSVIFALSVVILIPFICPPGSLCFSAQEELKNAPDFNLMDLYQDMIALSKYKDKQPVLLFFWTTWCPFCQNELRVLNDMYAGMTKDGVELLAINSGELFDTVNDFTKSYYLSYRVLLDQDQAVSRTFGVVGVPTYILVNKQGQIVFQGNYFPQRDYKALVDKG